MITMKEKPLSLKVMIGADIKRARKEYIEDTDGECDLEIEQDGEVC